MSKNSERTEIKDESKQKEDTSTSFEPVGKTVERMIRQRIIGKSLHI